MEKLFYGLVRCFRDDYRNKEDEEEEEEEEIE